MGGPTILARMADPRSREGARYGTPEVVAWLDGLHARHDTPLSEAFEADTRHGLPSIQVAPSEGALLGLMARLTGAKRAVEVGTLAGYSAIHLARGMGEGGRLWTLENDPKHAEVARANLAAAQLDAQVEVRLGDATDSLTALEAHAPFDLVFLDADKGRYDRYAAWAFANLREGGVLLADNVYFFGRLLDEEDPDAAAMRRFHTEVAGRFASTVIPTPDGLLLGLKTPAKTP